MATFPAIEPSTRTLTFGDYPQLVHEGASGGQVRFKFGNDRVTQILSLSFEYITEAQAQLIIDHYDGQQGSMIAFDLPSEIWCGFNTVPISASDYRWRYSDSFSVSIAAPLRYNISIDLETVPI